MKKLFIALIMLWSSIHVSVADRTDEYTIYGKIQAINTSSNSVEIINGEHSRKFNLLPITRLYLDKNEIKLSDLRADDIIEITFWHDGEIKERNNMVTLIRLIKR